MHIEVLVEDSSGAKLLAQLLPQILGEQGAPHTWRLKAYKGIGRIPHGLTPKADPAKRILLDQLPKFSEATANHPGMTRSWWCLTRIDVIARHSCKN